MNEKFSLTGGARIGKTNTTYPFINLFVNRNILKINVSIFDSLVFQPQDIISIEPYTTFSILGRGIKINHRVENYSSELIFWTFKDPDFVINEIKKVGFLSTINSSGIGMANAKTFNRQEQGGSPIKKSVAVTFNVLLGIFLLLDFLPFLRYAQKEEMVITNATKLTIIFLFAASIFTLISEKFRKIVLKEGRYFEEIKNTTYFSILLCGILLFIFELV